MSEPVLECIRDREGLWHVCQGRGDSWFRPILCGGPEGVGINQPGWSEERRPTCPECIEALKTTTVMGTMR